MCREHPNCATTVENRTTGEEVLSCPIEEQVTLFGEVCRGYQSEPLFHCCLQWMRGQYADAEDARSYAVLKAWQRLQTSTQEITDVNSWFFRLLHNHCVDERRAQARHLRTLRYMAAWHATHESRLTWRQESTEEAVLRHEMQRYIWQAIMNLPPRLREPCVLRFLEGMSSQDIAHQLGLSSANVRKRLQQARMLLRAAIVAYLAGQSGVKSRHRRG